MKFTWNEKKRLDNAREHKLDFKHAEKIFNGLELTIEDTRFSYPERRFKTIGLLDGKPVIAILTYEEEYIHVISFRKATRREAREYFATFERFDRLGPS